MLQGNMASGIECNPCSPRSVNSTEYRLVKKGYTTQLVTDIIKSHLQNLSLYTIFVLVFDTGMHMLS